MIVNYVDKENFIIKFAASYCSISNLKIVIVNNQEKHTLFTSEDKLSIHVSECE